LVLTRQEFASLVAEQLPMVPPGNILVEPEGSGLAAAIGLAAAHLRRLDPHATMAVLAADHLIDRADVFRRALAAAERLAAKHWLVTIGILPTSPETGYGYIERGEPLPADGEFEVFRVARFVEKPSQATAEVFLSSGRYSWYSGMSVWQVQVILDEIAAHMPTLAGELAKIEQSLGTPATVDSLRRVWPRIPRETIEYGVLERSSRVAVIPVAIGWSDVGNWAAVYDLLPHDSQGNAVIGQHLSPDTVRSLIYTKPHKLVATLGLDDMIVIDTEDVLLICPRSRAQEITQLTALLQAQGNSSEL
jgi:mannose-1-phosphate guanylyltransferase